MPSLVIRELSQRTVDALDLVAGPRKRESFVREILAREAERSLHTAGYLPCCRDDLPEAAGSVGDPVARELQWLHANSFISDPCTPHRPLPEAHWQEAPAVLMRLCAAQEFLLPRVRPDTLEELAGAVRRAVREGVPAPRVLYGRFDTDHHGIVPGMEGQARRLTDTDGSGGKPVRQRVFSLVAGAYVNAHVKAMRGLAVLAGEAAPRGHDPFVTALREAADAAETLVDMREKVSAPDQSGPLALVRVTGIVPRGDTERQVTVTRVDGVDEIVTVDEATLQGEFLEVARADEEDGKILIVLPREADSGLWRLWVSASSVMHGPRGPAAGGKALQSASDVAAKARETLRAHLANPGEPLAPLAVLVAGQLVRALGCLSGAGGTIPAAEVRQVAAAARGVTPAAARLLVP